MYCCSFLAFAAAEGLTILAKKGRFQKADIADIKQLMQKFESCMVFAALCTGCELSVVGRFASANMCVFSAFWLRRDRKHR